MPGMHTLRAMTEGDYDRVLDLWKGTEAMELGPDDSREAIGRFLKRNPGFSTVALEDGRIIGAVLCGHDSRRGYMHHLAVERTRRGRGTGTALAKHCMELLRGAGVHRFTIFLYHSNPKGRRFWEKLGWEAREDIFLMQTVLDEGK